VRNAIIGTTILAAMAVAAPACAAEATDTSYLQASVGVSVAGETEFDLVGVGSADVDLDTGVFASVAGGRSFANGFAIETEALYLKNDIESDDIDAILGVPSDPSVESLGLLVNVQYALPIKAPFSPYVGAGGGVGKTRYKVLGESDSTTGFMWQLMAGVTVPVSDQLTLDAKYRYLRSPEIDYTASDGVTSYTAEIETSAHVLSIGARYKF
jgi:opacity protein-like surface antigen